MRREFRGTSTSSPRLPSITEISCMSLNHDARGIEVIGHDVDEASPCLTQHVPKRRQFLKARDLPRTSTTELRIYTWNSAINQSFDLSFALIVAC